MQHSKIREIQVKITVTVTNREQSLKDYNTKYWWGCSRFKISYIAEMQNDIAILGTVW